MTIPLLRASGITLTPTATVGIARATVLDSRAKEDLSWDRLVRLKRAAAAISQVGASVVLDAGGFDGALAFFLESGTVDVLDPETTGGTVLKMLATDKSYDAVVAVDVLEHIRPNRRSEALQELARVARKNIVLNYPSRESKSAQELVFKLTNNAFIREHVEWELPDSDQVSDELSKCGFRGTLTTHTSVAIWLGQYTALNLLPEAGTHLNRYLIENFSDEPTETPLYHLLVFERA